MSSLRGTVGYGFRPVCLHWPLKRAVRQFEVNSNVTYKLSPFAVKKFSVYQNQNDEIVLGLRRQIKIPRRGESRQNLH